MEGFAPSLEAVMDLCGIETLNPGRGEITVRMGELGGMDPASTVLVGRSGWGHQLLRYAADFGVRRLVGIDAAPRLAAAAPRLRAGGLDEVRLVCGSVAGLPFADESFDVVTNEGAVGIGTDPARVLAEMLRVCRRGGQIVFREVCWNPDAAAAADGDGDGDGDGDAGRGELAARYGRQLLTVPEWLALVDRCGGEARVEPGPWDAPETFWDVRDDRAVAGYQEIFTAREKMLVGKRIVRAHGTAGLARSKANEDAVYAAVLGGRIGYVLVSGTRRAR